mmetsp:Transcript_12063/g.18095  ORF Transcript_12063/g.18095 Transcript_12063/m.18095 type:complete len:81 (-) Transcript_12063:949-1191(-)
MRRPIQAERQGDEKTKRSRHSPTPLNYNNGACYQQPKNPDVGHCKVGKQPTEYPTEVGLRTCSRDALHIRRENSMTATRS